MRDFDPNRSDPLLDASAQNFGDSDPWDEAIRAWMRSYSFTAHFAKHQCIAIGEIMTTALAVPPERKAVARVERILSRLGWRRDRYTIDGTMMWGYLPPAAALKSASPEREPFCYTPRPMPTVGELDDESSRSLGKTGADAPKGLMLYQYCVRVLEQAHVPGTTLLDFVENAAAELRLLKGEPRIVELADATERSLRDQIDVLSATIAKVQRLVGRADIVTAVEALVRTAGSTPQAPTDSGHEFHEDSSIGCKWKPEHLREPFTTGAVSQAQSGERSATPRQIAPKPNAYLLDAVRDALVAARTLGTPHVTLRIEHVEHLLRVAEGVELSEEFQRAAENVVRTGMRDFCDRESKKP